MKAACIFLVVALMGLPSAHPAANDRLGNPRLMQGPMVGWIEPDRLVLWLRLSGPFEVVVEYAETPDFARARATTPVRATKENDYVVKVILSELRPGTDCYYRTLVEGRADPTWGGLAPLKARSAPTGPAKFRVAFGSCVRLRGPSVQSIWHAIPAWEPDLFLWLGDNIYGDALDPDILAEEYRRLRDVPALGRVWASIGHLAVWDDHDYGLNDSDRTHPAKRESLAVFEKYWANPGFGIPAAPGVFFRYSYGGVDFFFLDGRSYRDPNSESDRPGKTFLGQAQLDWLRAGLQSSRAPFKVLVCGSGWSTAKIGGDSWASCLLERNDLFDFIRDKAIEGVVLLSGDTHTGELNAIPWSSRGGYDFYDLVSSPLVQTSRHSWVDRAPEVRVRQAFDATPNFGVLDFDLTATRPVLRFTLVNQEGRAVWDVFELHADELKNGVVSWPTKLDTDSRTRLERERAGQPYYR